jgi:hypothetical protein
LLSPYCRKTPVLKGSSVNFSSRWYVEAAADGASSFSVSGAIVQVGARLASIAGSTLRHAWMHAATLVFASKKRCFSYPAGCCPLGLKPSTRSPVARSMRSAMIASLPEHSAPRCSASVSSNSRFI